MFECTSVLYNERMHAFSVTFDNEFRNNMKINICDIVLKAYAFCERFQNSRLQIGKSVVNVNITPIRSNSHMRSTWSM